MTLLVSVVVPTYRRPGLLARCLAALAAQDLGPACYEVVVVDDEPSEATERVVRLHAQRFEVAREPDHARPGGTPAAGASVEAGSEPGPRIRYLAMPRNSGPAAARNAGWRAAEAPVVAFTDDDCLPQPGWLREGLAALGDADGATGRIVVPRPEHPTDFEAMTARLEHVEFATANCFYRRAALVAAGGFDERFPTAWREDSDLHFTLLEAGARLVHAPEALVVHPARAARWGVSLHEQRKSQHNALLYRKHPTLYVRHIQSRPPLAYYGIVAALVLLVVGLFVSPWLAALGAVAWLVQTLAFAWRRLRGTSHAPSHVAEMLVTSALIPPLSVFWRLRGAVRYRAWFW